VGRDAVLIAVGRRGRRAATEAKIGVPRIANRPAASYRQGCLCLCLYRRRLDEKRSGRFRRGAAVRLGGDRGGDLLNLVNRDRLHDQEPEHNGDGVGDVAVAGFPSPDVPRGDGEKLRKAALRDVECAEFGRSRR